MLPEAVWQDVLEGRLLAVDLAVLAAICFCFQTSRLHPQAERRRDAMWGPDETLAVRGLHRLVPQWTETIDYYGDAVAVGRQGIERRLAEAGWLVLDRPSVTCSSSGLARGSRRQATRQDRRAPQLSGGNLKSVARRWSTRSEGRRSRGAS